jgi:hypothetical protein
VLLFQASTFVPPILKLLVRVLEGGQRITLLGARVTWRHRTLANWRASRRVRGPRRCLISEVDLVIACRSSATSVAVTALGDRFIIQ